jgi:rifampicin phosphotransferase
VRSSSNSEDLPNWSGAGLFSTVPNVTQAPDLIKAVQTVWASVFNFEAFEARRHAGIPHEQVFMGVFVQRAVNSVVSGVMITRDPFDAMHKNAVYVSAKRGIGIKVVEGRRIAEQWMFDNFSGAARRLSRSDEDSAMQLEPNGGVVESAIRTGQDVLSDATVRALAKVGQRLKVIFKDVDQDIEWAIDQEGRIVVLQSRPYVVRY